MRHQRRFETANFTQRVQIKSLRRYVGLRDVDIETEEQSAQADRMDDLDYPQLARRLRTRRNNLAATLDPLLGRHRAPAGMQLVATTSVPATIENASIGAFCHKLNLFRCHPGAISA